MKLDAHLEIINNFATSKGYKSKNGSHFSQLSFAKDHSSGRYYLIINSTKNPIAEKIKLLNNVDKIFCKFVNEGKATLILKEPNFTLILQKANVLRLKHFLKIVHLANRSDSISDELQKIIEKENETVSKKSSSSKEASSDVMMIDSETTSKPLKKPTTSLIIKSRSEYTSNFRAFISQNLQIKTALGSVKSSHSVNLIKLIISNAELKRIDTCIFDLHNLTFLDLSNNKLSLIDNFRLTKLEELNLSQNEIKHFGKNITLPKLINLDISGNELKIIDKSFCENFKKISKLNINNNKLILVNSNFGFYFTNLRNFYATNNELKLLPFSCSHLRLEMVELNDNPFENTLISTNLNLMHKNCPTMVEICARKIVDKRIPFRLGEIPRTLFDYLDTSSKCICGRSCFEYKYNVTTMFDLNRISKSFTYLKINGVTDTQLPLEMNLCSWQCYKKNCKIKNLR